MFHGGIGISNVLNLSGDVSVNVDVPWSQYHAVVNAGDMRFNSQNAQLCCASDVTVYAKRFTVKNPAGESAIAQFDT